MRGSNYLSDGRRAAWLGPVLDGAAAESERAASVAAARWQRGLVSALGKEGLSVQPVTYVPRRAWPRGPAWVRGRPLFNEIEERVVGYWNVPAFRQLALGRSLVAEVVDYFSGTTAPAVVFTYNAGYEMVTAAKALRRRYACRWVLMVADTDARSDGKREKAAAEEADGCAYLSWGAFVSATARRKLHLDGGVARLPGDGDVGREKGLIVYTGALNEYGGLPLLLAAADDERLKGCRIVLTGKGGPLKQGHAETAGAKVEYLGLLPEGRLEELCRRASVFVNPRPPALGASEWNFPSKVLEYLSWGVPTVSTWTGGLAPEYRDLLVVCESAAKDALAASILEAVQMPERERRALRERIRTFLETTRTWERQAGRLVRWCADEGWL